jgi:2-polyprenyl-6-methoxyphenol hydroxylase-like FAD-dependent oxidoreductase
MDTVLVIGGRTTGLMMASELARRGVPVRCIDKSSGIDPHVRANLLHSRTLEIFLGLGLAERATEGSIAEEGILFYTNGELAGKSPHQPIDSPFPFGMSQSQAHVETVLEAHLAGLGVAVERGVELTGIQQDGAGVSVTLKREDGSEETVHSHWVVACDGAHSKVRHLTGCAFPGESDPFPYLLGDVVVDDDLERGKGHVFLHDSGELYLFSTLPGERRLICANLAAGQSVEGAPTLEELQSVVSQRGLPSLRLSDPRWLSYFHINYRLAPHYRQGRIFLAGDAAHIHSLLAGQGMNTGIQDAYNLGWKLAQVARQQAPVQLLDSYEIERRKVGEDVVTMTQEITGTLEHYAALSAQERTKLVAHMFTPEPERLSAARHLQEVDLNYGTSPLSLEPGGEFSGGPAAGSQAPDAKPLLFNGKSINLFHLEAPTGYRLYLFQGILRKAGQREIEQTAADAISRYGDWLEVCFITIEEPDSTGYAAVPLTIIGDPEAAMHNKYGADSSCLYLVRPDGYIAYRSKGFDSIDHYFK